MLNPLGFVQANIVSVTALALKSLSTPIFTWTKGVVSGIYWVSTEEVDRHTHTRTKYSSFFFFFGTKFKQISRHHLWVYVCVCTGTVHNGKWPEIALGYAFSPSSRHTWHFFLFHLKHGAKYFIYYIKGYVCRHCISPLSEINYILPMCGVVGAGNGTRLSLNYIEMKTKCSTFLSVLRLSFVKK